MILAWLLLLTGLTISAVAIYYSVVGLAAVFSAAVIPIVIMGSALEIGKLVCASWLKANWERAPRFMKAYMTAAVLVLMLITSMGIFGFLSKAHNDQNLVSGDVQSKIAIYDEKIKTAKENIEANRKQLKQMDEAVDQVMARSTDEKGADKSNAIRRAQQRDRIALAKDIEANQKLISSLNDEAAPIRAEVRKVEAEVGPIKYIAKFIYGDKGADENMLEKAVTWVIILIVVVFDPLAVIMLLAAQMTFGWKKEEPEPEINWQERTDELLDVFNDKPSEGVIAQEVADLFPEAVETEEKVNWGGIDHTRLSTDSDDEEDEHLHCYKCGTELYNAPGIGPYCPNKECDVVDNTLGAEPIEFTFVPPVTSAVKEFEQRLWDQSVANVGKDEEPKKEPKPRAKKEVTPKRNKKREEEQSALLTQFIEASSPATKPLEGAEALQVLKDTGIVTEDNKIAPAYSDERPGDYITASTVKREGSQDDLDNKYQEMVQDLQPERQSKYRRKPGFFPEVKRNTDNT